MGRAGTRRPARAFRAITDNACPSVAFDGKPTPMSVRAEPGRSFGNDQAGAVSGPQLRGNGAGRCGCGGARRQGPAACRPQPATHPGFSATPGFAILRNSSLRSHPELQRRSAWPFPKIVAMAAAARGPGHPRRRLSLPGGRHARPAMQAVPATPAGPVAGTPGTPISSPRRHRCSPPPPGSWCAAITRTACAPGEGWFPVPRPAADGARPVVTSPGTFVAPHGGLRHRGGGRRQCRGSQGRSE